HSSAVRADADRPPDVGHGRPAPGAEEDAVQATAAHTDRLAVDREARTARSRDRPGDRDPAAVATLLDGDPAARLRRAHGAGKVHPAAAPDARARHARPHDRPRTDREHRTDD